MADQDDQRRCDLCDGPVDATTAFDLELSVAAGVYYLDFCRQEHAAEWLTLPLPEPHLPSVPVSDAPGPWLPWFFLALVLWTIATAVIGSITLARLLVGS